MYDVTDTKKDRFRISYVNVFGSVNERNVSIGVSSTCDINENTIIACKCFLCLCDMCVYVCCLSLLHIIKVLRLVTILAIPVDILTDVSTKICIYV